MSRKSGSRDWALTQLAKHTEVVSVAPLDEVFIGIERKRYEPVVTAIMNERRVAGDSIEAVSSLAVELQFVTNMPRDSVWTGAAISAARERDLGWGGLGDLMRAINDASVRGFQKSEYSFVERGLRQHGRVEHYERLFDRLFRIARCGLPDITAALVYEYELTAEHVRATRERYGACSIIVKTNPNGGVTSLASEVGKGLGIEILRWGEFLGRLNRA